MTEDKPIQGLIHEVSITEENSFRNPEHIKNELIEKLIREVQMNGCVQFAKQHDSDSNAVTYRARIFVTPDSECRVIRDYFNENLK